MQNIRQTNNHLMCVRKNRKKRIRAKEFFFVELCTHLFNEKKISVMMRTNGQSKSILSVRSNNSKYMYISFVVLCLSVSPLFFWHKDIGQRQLKASDEKSIHTHYQKKKKDKRRKKPT